MSLFEDSGSKTLSFAETHSLFSNEWFRELMDMPLSQFYDELFRNDYLGDAVLRTEINSSIEMIRKWTAMVLKSMESVLSTGKVSRLELNVLREAVNLAFVIFHGTRGLDPAAREKKLADYRAASEACRSIYARKERQDGGEALFKATLPEGHIIADVVSQALNANLLNNENDKDFLLKSFFIFLWIIRNGKLCSEEDRLENRISGNLINELLDLPLYPLTKKLGFTEDTGEEMDLSSCKSMN